MLAGWPGVGVEPFYQLIDRTHTLELFGHNDALAVAGHLTAGEVNDIERGHSGIAEELPIVPLDLKCRDTTRLENEVIRKMVLLPLEIDGFAIGKLDS